MQVSSIPIMSALKQIVYKNVEHKTILDSKFVYIDLTFGDSG